MAYWLISGHVVFTIINRAASSSPTKVCNRTCSAKPAASSLVYSRRSDGGIWREVSHPLLFFLSTTLCALPTVWTPGTGSLFTDLLLGSLSKDDVRRRLRKRHLKSEVALLQTLSRLLHLAQFVQMLEYFFLELNSEDCIEVQEKKKKVVVLCSRPPQNVKVGIFTSWSCSDGKEMYKTRSVMHVQSCSFAILNLLLFCRSR